MADTKYDNDLLFKLVMNYRDMFTKTFRESGLVKDEKFGLNDYAYVMMHMARAFEVFDHSMENHFQELINNHTDPETEGMTAQ